MTAFLLGIGSLLGCVVFILKARALLSKVVPEGPLWFATKVLHGVGAVLCLILVLIMAPTGLAFLMMGIAGVQ